MAVNQVTRVNTPAFLQQFAIRFVAPGAVADRLVPRVRVAKQSAKYRVFGKNRYIRSKTKWAPGTIPNAIETAWSEGLYFAEFHVLREAVLHAEIANADNDIDPRAIATENVTARMIAAREGRIADLLTNSANYPGPNVITKAGAAEWNLVGGEAPITDMLTLAGTIADNALVPTSALTVMIPEMVFRLAILRNSAILDSIKYTRGPSGSGGWVTAELLAALLGVKEVIVGSVMLGGTGLESEGQDPVTGYTLSNPWLDNVWIGLVADSERGDAPSFARTFNWEAGTGNQARQVRQYETADPGQRADWIEVAEALDEKIVYSAAGGVIKNTLSTI